MPAAVLALLLLTGCTQPPAPSQATATPTAVVAQAPAATSTAAAIQPAATPTAVAPSPTSAPPAPSPTAAAPAPTGTVFTQQYEITTADSGRTFTYGITTRFGLILDQTKYPRESLQVVCAPPITLGSISNIPSVSPPLYAVRYVGVTPGKCTLADNDFKVYVQVLGP